MRLVPLNMFKPSSNFFTDRPKAVLLLWILFVIYIQVCLCNAVLSVPCSVEITCWESADLLTHLCVMFLDFCHFPIWCGTSFYYIPITDTTLELSVFWPSDTESRINELRFSESISLSFKTRLTSVTCFCGDVT